MTGEEVTRQIIMVLSTELGISSNLLIGAMHDRASVTMLPGGQSKLYTNRSSILVAFHTCLTMLANICVHQSLKYFLSMDRAIIK